MDEKRTGKPWTSGSAIEGFLRTVGFGSEPYTVAAVPFTVGARKEGLICDVSTISPAGGISISMMLCGSVTFFIGFMLLPWVIGVFMVFYVAGIISAISMMGRSIICYVLSPPSPRKDIPDPHPSNIGLNSTTMLKVNNS
ncbi:Detected protein of unknown function [Hibiscus syriacus]|uniref:Uncharacterized protein n=1 Tax=Hibiscus syriacus TaxID=106335 RepID=A0A6A3AWU0_HIBSY|nr:Detected protein of unknown function [Hibiscus syriacus]